MKTIKTKIELSADQELKVRAMWRDLEWVWNATLKQALSMHTETWFDWAHNQSLDKTNDILDLDTPLVSPIDWDGVVMTPIYVGKRSAWFSGATCTIASGGNYWKRSDKLTTKDVVITDVKNIPVIDIKDGIATHINHDWYDPTNRELIGTGDGKYRHPYILVEGDKPYSPILPQPYQPTVIADGKHSGEVITKMSMMQNSGRLNALRRQEGLGDLCTPSAYVNGCIDKLMVSWQAFLDPGKKNAKKPRFKGASNRLTYVYSRSNSRFPKVVGRFITNAFDATFGDIKIAEYNIWKRVPHDAEFRSWTMIKEPSGWYMCMSYNSNLLDSTAQNPGKGLICGIDPGVKVRVATDHGALFQGNLTRLRVQQHIETLQCRLDKMKSTNNKKLGVERDPTKNEIKLKMKIARLHEKGRNSSKAFDHKLSTRLSRTYSVISWEDTQLKNLAKQVKPKLTEDGSYGSNGRAAKAGLNNAMKLSTLGSLRSKTESKMKASGRIFAKSPAPFTSKKCACCGQIGYRRTRSQFICQNDICDMFGITVNADTNAGKNHKNSLTSQGKF